MGNSIEYKIIGSHHIKSKIYNITQKALDEFSDLYGFKDKQQAFLEVRTILSQPRTCIGTHVLNGISPIGHQRLISYEQIKGHSNLFVELYNTTQEIFSVESIYQ